MAFDPAFGRPVPPGIKAIVGSGWWRPRDGDVHHPGIDIWVPIGTPVTAVQDGEVTHANADPSRSGGKYIAIRHASGLMSRYMHLDELLVKKGAVVQKGQLIARSGNTGVGSTGPHLHLDLKATSAELLPQLEAEVGRPRTGYLPLQTGFGIGVPAEPWVPVDGYSPRTVIDAVVNGIPLYTARNAGLGPAVLAVVAVLGLVGWAAYRRYRPGARRHQLSWRPHRRSQ